jgi:hypothetical protein
MTKAATLVDGIYYYFNQTWKTATVTDDGNMYNEGDYYGTVNIPATVEYDGETYTVTAIASCAFQYCGGLTSVTIPNSVISIGNEAFEDCKKLTSIHIPASVTSIGVGAFWNTGWFNAQPAGPLYLDGWLLGYKGVGPTGEFAIEEGTKAISAHAFNYCKDLTSVIIPNSMTIIEVCAFYGCSSLTSVNIPSSVTTLGGGVFRDCSSLTSLHIPASVTNIEDALCWDCSSLASVTIEDGIASIGKRAFYGCSSLASVTIPGSVKTIGEAAFRDCDNLASVTIGDGVTSIGSEAFHYCQNLTSIVLPKSLQSIGSSAFVYCTSLPSINFPSGLTSIGNHAFTTCTSLTSITFPAGIKEIGELAFASCTSIMTVKSYIKEPFNVRLLFSTETYRQGTLYVPSGTKDLYVRFDGWRDFLKIEEMAEGDTPEPNGECATPTIVVVGNTFKFQCETPGAEFSSSLTMEENFTGDEVTMDNDETTYLLTVYATAPGYSQSKPATYTFTLNKSDVNRDGTVDVADISAIITTMAK